MVVDVTYIALKVAKISESPQWSSPLLGGGVGTLHQKYLRLGLEVRELGKQRDT